MPTECEYCGLVHKGMCPRIKSITYRLDGSIKSLVFHKPDTQIVTASEPIARPINEDHPIISDPDNTVMIPVTETPLLLPETRTAFNLSPTEIAIAREVAKGYQNKMIGRLIGIREATVKVHIKSILRKHRLMNRTQLAIWWQERMNGETHVPIEKASLLLGETPSPSL